MHQRSQPGPRARLLAHALVGAAAAMCASRVFRKGMGAAVAAAVITMALHEIADEPVAAQLSELGI